VGDIALDSISADGTDINIAVSDNSATALTVKEGANVYLTFDQYKHTEVITSAQDFTVATTKTFTTDTADINGGAIDGTIIGANKRRQVHLQLQLLPVFKQPTSKPTMEQRQLQ
jgi:hypothetical protein